MTFYGQTYDLKYLSLETEHKRYKNKRTHLNTSSLYLSISLKNENSIGSGHKLNNLESSLYTQALV